MASSSGEGCGEGVANKRKADEDDEGFSPKVKREDSDGTNIKEELPEATSELTTTNNKEPKVKKYKIDSVLSNSFPEGVIHEDFTCVLNQTNIRPPGSKNQNNKFYIMQVVKDKTSAICFRRWGRVGEEGHHTDQKLPIVKVDDAIKEFKKMFKQKTKNEWDKRKDFIPHKESYVLIEIDEDDDDEENTVDTAVGLKKETVPIKNEENMPLERLKMPLGKLSKNQINKGLEALRDIEKAIKSNKSREELMDLSSTFYTLVPHAFGKKIPPVLDTDEMVKEKEEAMLTLSNMGQ